jgi:hypothetical protein
MSFYMRSLTGASELAAGLYGGPQLVRDDPRIIDHIRSPEH